MIGKIRRWAIAVILALLWSLIMSPALAACTPAPSPGDPSTEGEPPGQGGAPAGHSGHPAAPWYAAPAVPRLSPGPARPVVYLLARDRLPARGGSNSWLVPLTVGAVSPRFPGSTSSPKDAAPGGPYPVFQALKLLFDWPQNDFLNTPVPPGLSVKGLTVNDRTGTLDLAQVEPKGLDPVWENLLIRSLVLTLTEDPAIDRVQILVDGKPVRALFGHVDTSRPLSRPPFINLSGLGEGPEGGSPPADTIPLVLWYGDPQAAYMVPVTRYVPKTPGTVKAALEQLSDPEPGLGRVLPDGARVRRATVREGTATVDFSAELRTKHWGGTTGESQTINGIIYSVGGLPGVKKVNILIEGRPGQSIAGHVVLEPRERGLVNQVRLEDLPSFR